MIGGLFLSHIRNFTSGADIVSPAEGGDVEVMEWGLSTLVCRLPRGRAAAGHLVSLQGTLSLGKDQGPFVATGKIASSEDENPKSEWTRVTIQLRQVETPLWLNFLETMVTEQQRVDRLLETMKGEP